MEKKNKPNIKRTLWIVFFINLIFAVIESVTGIIGDSFGLITDSADMFADAMVYGLSIFALNRVAFQKKRIAYFQCIIQTILIGVLAYELVRRAFFDNETPDYRFMITVACFAFIGNLISYVLLHRLRSHDTNIRTSEICSRMDCFISLGIVIGGLLVMWFDNKYPDLIIGGLILIYATKELVEMYMTAHKGEIGCGCVSKLHGNKNEVVQCDCDECKTE